MDTTRELNMPSGFEVESAALHPPIHGGETSVSLPERSGIRGKLDTLKSRGLTKAHDIQRVMNDRGTALRGSLMRRTNSMREGAMSQVGRMQASMRTSPMLWAGVAAGAGFGLGLIGRVAQWRSRQRQSLPSLVVIEASC